MKAYKPMLSSDDMIGLIHKECNGLAFWYNAAEDFPCSDAVDIYAGDVMYPNGTRPSPFTTPTCQHCGKSIQSPRNELTTSRIIKKDKS